MHAPVGEPRRDPRLEPERRAEKQPLHRAAVLIEVLRLGLARHVEAKRLQAPAVVFELCRENFTVAGEGRLAADAEESLAVDLLVQHAELVATPQVVVEIDLAAEHLGHGHGQQHALVLGVQRGDQRVVLGVDAAFHHLLDAHLPVRHHGGLEAVADRVHPQKLVVVDVVRELPEAPVVDAEIQAIGVVDPQPPRIEDLPDRLDQRVRHLTQVVPGEQACQRRSVGHSAFERARQRRQEDVFGAVRHRRRDARRGLVVGGRRFNGAARGRKGRYAEEGEVGGPDEHEGTCSVAHRRRGTLRRHARPAPCGHPRSASRRAATCPACPAARTFFQ